MLAGGTALLALAVAGAILPGLPGAIFLIPASWLFARSVPAVNRALTRTPLLGPHIQRWMATRSMPARAKALAVAGLWCGTGGSTWLLAHHGALVLAPMIALSAAVTAFLLLGIGTGAGR